MWNWFAGDTGYESLSSASMSSYMSNVELVNGGSVGCLKPVLMHKPKIVTSSGNSMTSSANLKQLKTNLKPLPGIRAPK